MVISGLKCRFPYGLADATATHYLFSSNCRLVFGRPYYRSSLWYSVSSVVCIVLYCGETVRPSEKVSEGVNRKSGSKSSFFGSLPYFYFRFHRYGHQDGRFCFTFAQQSVLDCRNWLSSSKPCAYCWIVWSELKPDSRLFVCITLSDSLRLKCC